MSDDLKHNLKNQNTWKRGLYMLLFSFLAGIADFVLIGVVIFQFVHKLLTGKTNERLLKLGRGLASYVYQIIQFMTFNSEYHPYPLGAWPKASSKPDSDLEEKP
ncbi:MAG: DUF4389 domain-containing protein [Gammaproteobacteria bacterium]|nr:DUF4389 domain-containing protein [Gammaproteobacteria bacterium]